MAVLRENLTEFYFVSPHWDEKSQRLLGTVGFEFEIAERAFDSLYQLCLRLTDSGTERWRVSEGDAAELAILARAFIDHAVRIQKILKSMAKPNGEFSKLCEKFFIDNREIFGLRDSLHHVESRIEGGVGSEELHPAHGDLSWKTIVPPDKLDCFWLAFGSTVLGEFAGPVMSTGCTLKLPIDELIYRAHGISVDLTKVFQELARFMAGAHSHFQVHLEKTLVEQGIVRNQEEEEKAAIGLHGRLRIGGLTIT